MRRTAPLTVLLALAFLAFGTAAAFAAVSQTGEGTLHEFCADSAGSSHPGRAHLLQPILSDRFEGPGPHAIYLGYHHLHFDDPMHQHQHQHAGRLLGKAVLVRADGSRQRLGRVRFRMQSFGESPFGMHTFNAPLEPGDMIQWHVRLRDMDHMDQGDCFMLYTAVTSP